MFAHGVELQHQSLHHTAFHDRRLTEIVGVVLGLPMLVSFAGYQAAHLRHHRNLGTDQNTEFFDYGDQYGAGGLTVARHLFLRFTMAPHYLAFIVAAGRALCGSAFPGETASVSRRMRRDYLLMLGAIGFLGALCVVARSAAPLLLWLMPLLLVAAPVHALVEMPEHYHCDTDSTEVFANTRTIRSNAFMTWFTNGNNFHVEHHLLPSVGVERLQELHERIAPRIEHHYPTYRAFFREALGFGQSDAVEARRAEVTRCEVVGRPLGSPA
jgi:fatty acid desaturase